MPDFFLREAILFIFFWSRAKALHRADFNLGLGAKQTGSRRTKSGRIINARTQSLNFLVNSALVSRGELAPRRDFIPRVNIPRGNKKAHYKKKMIKGGAHLFMVYGASIYARSHIRKNISARANRMTVVALSPKVISPLKTSKWFKIRTHSRGCN